MTATDRRPNQASTAVTISMTETVTYEITLTPARLAELLDTDPSHVAQMLAGAEQTGVVGPVQDLYALLEDIDRDTYRAGVEDRTWSIRTPGHSTPPSPICDPHQLTDEIRAAADEHTERRARALLANGVAEDAAIAQAADEAIELTRRTVQLTRQARALAELVDAYQTYGRGSTFRLLRDLGDHLSLSLAYVDRDTVEAHLERGLSDVEWAATNNQFTALDFDEHIGDQNTFRTGWIETVLEKAGVPGSDYTTDYTAGDSTDDARAEDAVADEDVRA